MLTRSSRIIYARTNVCAQRCHKLEQSLGNNTKHCSAAVVASISGIGDKYTLSA